MITCWSHAMKVLSALLNPRIHRSPVESLHEGTVMQSLAGDWWNIWYLLEINLKLKSCEIVLVHNIHFIHQIVLNFSKRTTAILPCSVRNVEQFDNLAVHYGQTRFREIWIEDAFRMDILHCTSPLFSWLLGWTRCWRNRLVPHSWLLHSVPSHTSKYT